jgi:hypothetical protein
MTTELRRASAPDTPQFRAELGRWLAASMGQTTRPAAGRGRRRVAVLALAGLVAVGLVAVPVLGPRPPDTAVARSFKLANGTVIGIEEFFDAKNFARLRQQFAAAGATLVINEIPVHDRAIGRVFSVQLGAGQPPAANADPSGVRVRAGERVEVTVGRRARPDERVTTQGLTLFEIFPKVKQAIARDDAIATGKALRALGFKIRWELIELNPGAGPNEPPTKQTRIVEPSPGMVVLSVLGPNGEGDSVDPFTDTLMVEVMTSREAREQLGHYPWSSKATANVSPGVSPPAITKQNSDGLAGFDP